MQTKQEKILYFPYIAVPKSAWTIKSILYWDEVNIIVPQEYLYKPQKHDKYTLDLIKSEVVKQVFVYNYLNDFPNFDNIIISRVGKTGTIDKFRKSFKDGHRTNIHVQKFGEKLFRYLIKEKIAQEGKNKWIEVESKIADLIMFYLAKQISKKDGSTPSTDKINVLKSLNTRLVNNSISRRLIDDLLVLPYPAEFSLNKLIKFKVKYNNELLKFRKLIETTGKNIGVITSNHRERKYNECIEELRDSKKKIESDIKSNFKTLRTGLVLSACSAASFMISPFIGLISLGSGVLTSAMTVREAKQYFAKQKEIESSSLYFLYLIDKELS